MEVHLAHKKKCEEAKRATKKETLLYNSEKDMMNKALDLIRTLNNEVFDVCNRCNYCHIDNPLMKAFGIDFKPYDLCPVQLLKELLDSKEEEFNELKKGYYSSSFGKQAWLQLIRGEVK